jgi:hypothetical protein
LSCPLDGSSPAPKSLGVRIDSGADSEPIVSVEENAIEKVRLSSSVQSSHGYDRNGLWYLFEKAFCLGLELIFYIDYRLLPC